MPFREAHPSGKESGFPKISSNSEADEKRLRLGWRKALQGGVRVEAVAYSAIVRLLSCLSLMRSIRSL